MYITWPLRERGLEVGGKSGAVLFENLLKLWGKVCKIQQSRHWPNLICTKINIYVVCQRKQLISPFASGFTIRIFFLPCTPTPCMLEISFETKHSKTGHSNLHSGRQHWICFDYSDNHWDLFSSLLGLLLVLISLMNRWFCSCAVFCISRKCRGFFQNKRRGKAKVKVWASERSH